MKPTRKLLCSAIFLAMTSSPQLHAASDITIKNTADDDITPSTPFKDASNDGGTSNLNVTTLTGALGTGDVQVTTVTSAGLAPLGGQITVSDPITWSSSQTLSLFADSKIVVGATINSIGGGSLSLASGAATDFNTDVTLFGSPAKLSVQAAGITQSPIRKLTIEGLADLDAGLSDIVLLSANNFGSLKLTGGAVTVNEVSGSLLTGVNATSLNLTSAGAITDTSGAVIDVSGLATLNAGANPITFGDNPGGTTDFGSLNLTGTVVTVTEDSATGLAGVSAADLTLTSNGSITDTGNLNVSGLATLNAGGNAITLGDDPGETTDFGSLNLTGGAVTISEDSATVLAGVNTASLTLTSNGTITDVDGASLIMTGLATFNAGGNAVTLGDNAADTTRFGSLSVTGGVVNITEDDGTLLADMSATTLNLTSAGALTSSAGAVINVTGIATLKGTSIALGNLAGDSVDFDSLNFNSAGSVAIGEDSPTLLIGTNTGLTLALGSTGALTHDAGASLTVTDNASFAGTSITLGTGPGDTMNFGSLTFNSTGAVVIQEDSSTVLSGASTGLSLALNSTGAITDAPGSGLSVTNALGIKAATSVMLDDTRFNVGGNTTFTVGNGGDVAANNAANVFTGTVTFVASAGTLANVNIADTTALDLQPLTLTGGLTAISGAALTDSGELSVAGLVSLGGATIQIGGSTETTNFGSLEFNSAGAVTIQEDSSTLLSGASTGLSLVLSSTAALANDATANLAATNNASFAGTSISLGTVAGDTMNFGSLTFNTVGAVTIQEDSSTVLSGASTGLTLALGSTGALTNDATADLAVTNNASFAGTSISLGTVAGDSMNFGTLTLNSTGAVAIQEDSSTLLSGASTGLSLALSSTGALANDATANLTVANNASFAGTSISLGTVAGDSMNFGSLTFNTTGAATIQVDSPTVLSGASTGLTLALGSTGALTDDATANLAVTNNASFSGASISLGGVAGDTMNFGTLTFNSAGAVTIQEDSSMLLSGASTGLSLALRSTDTITGAPGSSLAVTNAAGIEAATSVMLADTRFNVGGNTTFTAGNGGDIVANNTANVFSGTVGFAASVGTLANVNIFDTTALDLQTLTLTGGLTAISDAALADSGNLSVGGLATLRGSTIFLGGAAETTNFGSLNFNSAGAVTIQEDSSTLLSGTNTAGSLALTSAGALTDSGNLSVTGLASLNGTSIMVGGAGLATHFGSLTVNSPGAVGVQEDSDTQFVGSNSASVLTLTSSGVSTFTAGSTLNATTLDIQNQSVVLTGDNLVNTIGVKLANGTTLTLTGADTIGTLISTGGTLAGSAALTATGGATFNGGTISGHLLGDMTSTGTVLIDTGGSVGGGFLHVDSGTLTFRGTSTSMPVTIAALAALTDTGNLSNTAAVTNAGLFTVNGNDTIGTYTQNGAGILAGSAALTATGGATLNGGTISGHLLGDMTSTGTVLIDTGGSVGDGFLHVDSGMLTLNGTASSNTTITGATLKGTGTIIGDVVNAGTLAVGSMGNKLTIAGNLTIATVGKVDLALNSPVAFEQIKAGSVNLGGELVVTNTGAGLANGEEAKIIEAGLYGSGLTAFNPVGFSNGVLFNGDTGMLHGLAGGAPLTGGAGYLNLTGSQTNVYLSLFEDSVQPGVQNVTRVGNTVIFASGASNGDPQLVRALNQATFTTTPGTIDINTVNTLSPEVHRGMADYTEQSLRSHVRQAVDAAPVVRNGRTQVFATLHTESAGVDDSITAAGYDTEMYGVTAGMRYDINRNFQIGGLFGMDGGNITGTLIDTDAQGFVLGAFARYFLRNPLRTVFTASATYGGYSYDASRRSFGGLANADGIGSDAFELALGVSTVIYEKDGFVVAPSAAFRYMTGSVDGFVESGPGVGLAVASQDIDSFLFDIGVDFSYQIEKRWSLVGHLGYIFDFSDSDETVSASFAATVPSGMPFSVSAPGFDHQGLTLGLGAYYDINDSTRVGMTYNGEFRSDSNSSHTIGVGVSYGF